MAVSIPPRASIVEHHRLRHFLVGLGLGVMPLIVALVGIYGGNVGGSVGDISLSGDVSLVLLLTGTVLYVVALIAMIVCLVIARVRFVGYGLLAAVASSPVLFIIGFVVTIRLAGPLPF